MTKSRLILEFWNHFTLNSLNNRSFSMSSGFVNKRKTAMAPESFLQEPIYHSQLIFNGFSSWKWFWSADCHWWKRVKDSISNDLRHFHALALHCGKHCIAENIALWEGLYCEGYWLTVKYLSSIFCLLDHSMMLIFSVFDSTEFHVEIAILHFNGLAE